jgi:membrane protein DedA with SNARE-associated domain
MEHSTFNDIWHAVSLFFENVDVQELVQRHRSWFYTITFMWSFLEGETFLLFAGAAAAQDILDIRLLILFAWMGSFCGDSFYFYLGRRFGKAILDKRPKFKKKTDKVFDMILKHDVAFMLGYRFIWGIRTFCAFGIGLSGHVPWRKFLFWNLIAAFMWAVVFSMIGFLFGEALDNVLGEIHWVLLGILGLVVGIFAIKLGLENWHKHRHKWLKK